MVRFTRFATLPLLITLLVATSSLYSQTDFEKWKKAEAEKYQQWKDERDKAFTDFLKQEWKRFKAFKEQTLFDAPKPRVLPIAPPHKETKPQPDQKVETKPEPRTEVVPDAKIEKNPEGKTNPKPEVKPETKPEVKPDAKPEVKPETEADVKPEAKPENNVVVNPQPEKEPKVEGKPVTKPETKPETEPVVSAEGAPVANAIVDPKKNPNSLSLDFYEASVPLLYNDGMVAHLGGPPSGKTISAFWEAMSKSNYEDFVKQAQLYREKMKLNDWGYCEILHKTAVRLYPGSVNEPNLFVWFMLLKSGYQAKIGYSGDNVYLLLPTSNTLYAVAYYVFANSDQKFYNVMFDRFEKARVTQLYSYDQDYPNATRLTGYQILSAPSIRPDTKSKTLKFTHNGSEYTVKVDYDQSSVKFFEYYPQTDLQVYFDAVPSTDARRSLLEAMKPFVKDKSETEAVDLLLHFVQTAFEYKTDDEQFGREKPFFPEETLYYPGSDCEDRSVLFSFLVRNLLGLQVVGLDYPNHVSTAVKFNGNVKGDQVVYQNSKYIICDPTYINADYGMCMPQFKKVKPGIIALK
jgi:hypothetical protein